MFAGHRIDGVAGRGGMGVVYRATQLALDRPVALKLITPAIADSPEFRERFRRESRLAARIEHPNAVAVYHAGEEDGQLFVTMRLVDGTDLGSLLAEQGALPPREAARVVGDVGAALDAAHALGLVHRDVKPANILVDRDGRVFLTDFGLTKRTEGDGLTATGQWVGTLDYVPPEQIRGLAVTARSDVYALGCVLYQALTGRVPYPRRDPAAIVFAHVHEPVPVPSAADPRIPAGLDAVVARAMAKDPDDRYPRAGDLGEAARRAASDAATPTERAPVPSPRAPAPPPAPPAPSPGPPSRPTEPRDPQRTRRRRGGRPLTIGLVVAAAFAVGFGAVLLATRDDGGTLRAGAATGSSTAGGTTTGVTPPPAGCREPLRVAGEPGQMTVGDGAIWVTDVAADRLVRVDPAACAVTARIAVGDRPGGVWSGRRTGLWITNDIPSGAVQRIDPGSGEVTGGAPTGANPKNLEGRDGTLWTADYRGDSVTAVDGASGTRRGTLDLGTGSSPRDLGVLSGVWVIEETRRAVALIDGDDPSAPRLVRRIALGGTPNALATSTIGGRRQVWVTDRGDGLTRIDVATAEAVRVPLAAGSRPTGVTAGAGRIWVALTGADRVVGVDHLSGRPVTTAATPSRPFSVVADDAGRVWALTRGGLLVQVTGPEGARLT